MTRRQPARLRRRAEFVAAAGGARVHRSLFTLQARQRDDSDEPRLGFTVTRKAGGAVERNRMRRRLREAAKAVFSARSAELDRGIDYVIVARRGVLGAGFGDLVRDISAALGRAPDKLGKTNATRSES